MGATRTIGRLLERIAPSAARRLRSIWYTANGGRTETLAGILEQQMHGHRQHLDQRLDAVPSLLEATHQRLDACRSDAARFSSRMEESGGAGAAFALQDSIRRLERAPRSGGARIALVSVLPPMQTGIADYSLRTFEASPVPVDVFAPFPDAGSYLAAVHRLPQPDGPLTIHALETLSYALATRRYDAVIWVLGNSGHHLPVLRLLREMRHLDPMETHWVQLHDPVLFNLVRLYADQLGTDPATLLRPAAVAAMPKADWRAVARANMGSIVDHMGLPARALFADLPLRGVILHSRAALELLVPDWPELARMEQRLLYLPVTERFMPRGAPPGGGLRIGTFGYPAPSKGTDKVLAAFRQLRRQRPDARLVLAGYHVARYAQEEGLGDEPGLELHDNPPMTMLAKLMDGVDLAIQMRTHNSGESSGIVPQLLSRDVPTIVTAIGAFAEYGEAVRGMPADAGVEELGAAILEEVAQPARRQAARRTYVETHQAGDFCAAVLCGTATVPALRRA